MSTTVRAKFKVDSVTRSQHWDKSKGELHSVKLSPVTSGSKENEAFYAATPCGQFELSTLNEEAGKQFELGKAYYVDFTPAE
jgi:hypothetical protein